MSWITRFRNALSPRRLDRELEEEIWDHIERRAADLRREGFSDSEAKRRAALAFGNIAQVREQSRELRLWGLLQETNQDIRYALRGLRRNPVFAATAILSLGLAIGANTAIYSIVEAAMLRPLPVPEPDRLFVLSTPDSGLPGLPASGDGERFSYPLYEQLRGAAAGLASLALFDAPALVEAQAAGPEGPYEKVVQQFVSPNAFDVLGVSPELGGLFSTREDHFPDPRAAVVLSYDYWQRRFGKDPAIVGRRFVADGRTYSVVGVARPGFAGAEPGKFVDVWLPITTTDPNIFTNPDIRLFHLMGRLTRASSRVQLAAQLQPVFKHHQEARLALRRDAPAAEKHLSGMPLQVEAGANGISAFRRTYSRPLWILLAVSVCILLIASANVANLLIARSTARSAEMALRVSLGARRTRLVRQLFTESLLISFAAGLLGWALANAAGPALVTMVSTQANPVQLDLVLDRDVWAYCAAVSAISAIFFGLLPAWQATGTSAIYPVRHTAAPAGRLRIGRLLVGLQVAFALCLLTGGLGFLFSLRNLVTVDAGFDAAGVKVLSISNTPQRDRQLVRMQQIQLRVADLPGVQAVAAGWMPLFSGARRADRVVLPGREPSDREETFYRVSPGYFAALRTPLVSGRDLTFSDNDNEPVATVVNRAFATRYFATEAVLGREFRRDDGVRHVIVGVAADSHFGSLRGGPEPIVYMPMKPPRGFTLYVRSKLAAGAIAKMVDREAEGLGGGLRVRDVTTLDALVETTIRKERILAFLGGAFGFTGLGLTAAGVFGLLNYTVTRRTKEIGIRAALGAKRPRIYALVLRDLVGMVGGGLILGLPASLVLMRFTQSLSYGIRPADPIVIGAAMTILLAAAIVAIVFPARRAAAIDPIQALREE